MAPGRADQRFVAKFAKAASTGILLVLAVTALSLAGCGGGSSDGSGEDSSEATSTAAATSDGAEGAGSDPAAGATAGAPSAAEVAEAVRSVEGGGGGQPSSGGKKGPPVPVPTGAPAAKITPEQRQAAIVANLTMQSSSSVPSAGGPDALPAEYTCDGKNISPALSWEGVPEGTAELVLFAMNVAPVQGALFFDWAVAGLSPQLEGIEAGKLPKGAVVGRNSFGENDYGICPESGGETYMFTLFAVPEKLSPAKGFDPMALRKAVHGISRDAGLLALNYTRG